MKNVIFYFFPISSIIDIFLIAPWVFVDSRRRRVLDEVLVTWTVSFGGWDGFSSFHLADPVSEHFCDSTIASH